LRVISKRGVPLKVLRSFFVAIFPDVFNFNKLGHKWNLLNSGRVIAIPNKFDLYGSESKEYSLGGMIHTRKSAQKV
jgi:hypothetical protein